MTGYVPGEQPRDGLVIKLNTNENPYPPSPAVQRAVVDFSYHRLARYPDPLCTALREVIAAKHRCAPAQVLVGNGSDEVLALALRAFVERNGTVGYFDPSYSLYPVLARIEDVVTTPVPLQDDYQWRMPPDYQASLFFLAYPNAPTGIAYELDLIREFCVRFRGVVLIDEAYADFSDRTCSGLLHEFDNVLVARTLSKSYSLAGLRLGYVVGPDRLIAALLKIKDSYNVSALAQHIALAALGDEAYTREVISRIVATRERVTRSLREMGFQLTDSQTNFLWTRPPEPFPAEYIFRALKERGIYVRHFPGPRTGDHLRISIGTDEQMDRLVEALATIKEQGHDTNS
jgi:histidinol-phosphate aminotransferase